MSSRTHIRGRLRAAFGPEHAFAASFSGPVAAREIVVAESSETRFVLRHAGRTINRAEVEPELHGTPVEVVEGFRESANREADTGEVVRETTVEVFVAIRQ